MNDVINLPKDLSKLKNIKYKNINYCTFAKYVQFNSSHTQFINIQNHLLTFVKKGYKILHTAYDDFKINTYEALFLKSGNYTLSNIGLENGVYEAYLFFFDNSFLIDLINKYKNIIDFSKNNFQSEIFTIKNDEVLRSILDSFTPHLDDNTQVLDPIVNLKFEEIFLHLLLNKNLAFSAFLKDLIKEFSFDLNELFVYYEKDFFSVLDMADYAKMDISTFSKEFKKCFGIAPKKWLDEKRMQKAKFLLEFSKKNINEISLECGFSSVAWFIKRFCDKFNQTPKQYQKSKNLYFLSKN